MRTLPRTASTWVLSCRWPAVISTASGRPRPSLTRWIFGSPALLVTIWLTPLIGPPRSISSGRVEYARLQQGEPGTAIHRPLDDLQPIHLALHGPSAPRLRQARLDRRLVLADPTGE